MKKNLTSAIVMMMAMLMTMFTFTSCETDDELIADYLTYGNWEGYLGTYYENRWGEYVQDGEYHTVWRFKAQGYDRYGYATSGYGDEVDYSTRYRSDYAYCSFRWEVRNGNIYIDYDDSDWNPVKIDWRDYSINRSRFHGTMYDWENRAYDFDLTNTYWDWDPYYDRYWARTRSADSTDTADNDVYISDNGKCIATGVFAKAMQNMKKTSN